LEVDRRQIRRRIDKLKADLVSFRMHRLTTHKKRKKNNLPSVALVGYTSAGKSTLLNLLTGSEQPVSEKLFTTLDPLAKVLKLPGGQDVLVSDTVGFLHELPHHLIEAFKATLEEVAEADLLVHVLDLSDQRILQHNQAVKMVLDELGLKDKPVLTALNKADLLEECGWPQLPAGDFGDSVVISAKTGKNIESLLTRIQGYFASLILDLKIMVPHSRMDLVDLFYRCARVEKVDYLQEGINIRLKISRELFKRIEKDEGVKVIY
jgi:GTP-binding protein HflX